MSHFDLLIIGGGINGAGIARDAAGRGLSVMLVEKGDLAEATSSRSTKLIHGGLRYLEYYQFRLVRESLCEREVLLRIAPHIIWPVQFVLPHSPVDRPAWLIRLGLWLYDHLGGKISLPRSYGIEFNSTNMGRFLRPEYHRGFVYSDCWVDDSRLVVLNALDAAERGAEILTRTRFISAKRQGRDWQIILQDLITGSIQIVTARALVNAAGPWVSDVITKAGESSPRRIRLVKGSHIIVKRFWHGDNNFILQNHDRRIVFANQFQSDLAIIGTTDVPYEGDAAAVEISQSEIDYLLASVNGYFKTQLSRPSILASYAGVRPLYDDVQNNPSAVSRDYVFDLEGAAGEAPLLSIFGGKITTYRRLAEGAMARLKSHFPHLPKNWTGREPLPGGDFAKGGFDGFVQSLTRDYPWLPESLACHYARLYGTRTSRLIGSAQGLSDLGEEFGGQFYAAEAQYLCQNEWAKTAEDILLRRTKHAYHLTPEQTVDFTHWFNQHFGS
ncbi:MAG: glycerol-3-phosphate dehydrogenase [Candidatus Pacebacteria bacterium]|nr:glycerol-3-phosphate dehydrogenase [Candidatus Paceibacterota bacterium]